MGTVVRLEDYCKSFKSAEVLKNINLTLESGKVIGLKGKNGSGKTMLMRAISGLILPTSGKVYINDKELGRHISFPPSIGILNKIPILGGNEMCLPSSLSLMYTFPDVGSISPLIALISIVLPEPFLPLSPITFPLSSVRLIFFNTSALLNDLQ